MSSDLVIGIQYHMMYDSFHDCQHQEAQTVTDMPSDLQLR